MDWDLAIKRNGEALNAIVAALFAMLGLVGSVPVGRIPPPLHRAVLRLLRPAESAARRLIVIVARGLVVALAPERPKSAGPPIGKGGGHPRFPFKLFDPRKSFAELRQPRAGYTRNPPRIHVFPYDSLRLAPGPVAVPPPPPDGLVNGQRIARRLQALKFALDDLPRQARRLARWRVRRESAPNPKFRSPLRPGPPPSHRKRPVHEVDEVLANCHWLAWEALAPDTS